VDTTLVGFENMKWIRGEISFVFAGETGEVFVLDHKKQTVEKMLSPEPKKSESGEEDDVTDLDLKKIMRPNITRVSPFTDHVVFTAAKTWLGYEKTEKVGDDKWNAKVFDIDGFDLHIINRKINKRKTESLPDNVSLQDVQKEMAAKCEIVEPKPHGLLFPNEDFSEKTKTYRGTVWLSPDFPRKVEELVPIFEILAPTQKHFDKLNKFISLKMPTDGFPVKLDIPVFPTITASVTFLSHKEGEIDPAKFEIPSTYRSAQRSARSSQNEHELDNDDDDEDTEDLDLNLEGTEEEFKIFAGDVEREAN